VPRWGVTHHSHAPAHSHGAAPGRDDVFDRDHRGAEMEREAELEPDLFWPAAQTVYTGRAAEDDETGPRS
jgi:hypothetical protein